MTTLYLFEDVFEVQVANPDGKFFDKGAFALSIAVGAPSRKYHPDLGTSHTFIRKKAHE
jgi:hypothetical protein